MQTSRPLKHNPVTFFLRTLLYCLVTVLLRVMTFAPLASLLIFPQGSPFRYLALLCPVLFIFLLLPLRMSFAQALVQNPPQRFFSFDIALGIQPYGEKLGEGLLHALSVAKWAIPLAGMGAFGYYYFNNVFLEELSGAIVSLGRNVTGLYVQLAVFLGNLGARELSGGLMEGIYALLGILGLGLGILLIGIMRNSAFRYVWALAYQGNRNPRTEARRRLKGRRFLQFLVAVFNLLLLTPFLWMVANSIKPVLGDLSMLVVLLLSGAPVMALDFGEAVLPLFLAFFCLYLPLLPIRRIATAYFATKRIRAPRVKKAPKAPQPATSAPAAAPAPVYIPPVQPVSYPQPYPPETEEAPVMATLELDEATGEFFPSPQGDDASSPRDDHDPSAFTVGQ